MCFSPGADFVVGGLVVGIGVDALRHVREPKQILLGSLPLLFGLHQIDEAFVWLGLQGHVSESVERVGVWVYVLFALAVVPALVPFAALAVERARNRRRVIGALAATGTAVGLSLGVSIFRGSVNAMIENHHIAYDVSALSRGGQITALYVVVVCGALVVSSHRDLNVLGALNFVAVPILMWMTVSGFISLWCFWAAIVSVIIDVHLRKRARSHSLTSARARTPDVSNVT